MNIECNHCHQVKLESEFNWRWKGLGKRQRTCRDCQKIQKNSWYERNKETHKANTYENKQVKIQEGREYIRNYLLTHPCIDCGERDPIVLEFDHVRGNKKSTVMLLVRNGYSLDVIQKEISKCVVRCANCHKRKTYKGSWREE